MEVNEKLKSGKPTINHEFAGEMVWWVEVSGRLGLEIL